MMDRGASADADRVAIPPIEVTAPMLAAGREELAQHRFGDDLDCLLEEVYRAMAYAAATS